MLPAAARGRGGSVGMGRGRGRFGDRAGAQAAVAERARRKADASLARAVQTLKKHTADELFFAAWHDQEIPPEWFASTEPSDQVLPSADHLSGREANTKIKRAFKHFKEKSNKEKLCTPMNVLRYWVTERATAHALYAIIRRFIEVLRQHSARLWVLELVGDGRTVWDRARRFYVRASEVGGYTSGGNVIDSDGALARLTDASIKMWSHMIDGEPHGRTAVSLQELMAVVVV